MGGEERGGAVQGRAGCVSRDGATVRRGADGTAKPGCIAKEEITSLFTGCRWGEGRRIERGWERRGEDGTFEHWVRHGVTREWEKGEMDRARTNLLCSLGVGRSGRGEGRGRHH